MSGSGFAQAVVFSFMANPVATREAVNQTAANAGMKLSTPGLDKRFDARGATFLGSVLAEAVKAVVKAQSESESILSRFNGVYIGDSTIVKLPKALVGMYQGSNGVEDAAAKVAVQWELDKGGLSLWLSDGTIHDQRTGIVSHTLPAGALRLNDLGFFNLETFAADIHDGVYFFSRYKVGTLVYTEGGQTLDLARYLRQQGQQACDLPIQLGAKRLPCRLIALPVSPEQVGKRRKRLRDIARRKQQPLSERALALAAWTLFVTNIPPDMLSTAEAAVLGCTRWQIECLFKLWKSDGRLDESRSHDPYRVLCEFYARLLALLIQHWIMVVGCWQHLDRSLHQATQVIRKRAFCLLDALSDVAALTSALQKTAVVMAQTCHLSKRATCPLTFQRWLGSAHG